MATVSIDPTLVVKPSETLKEYLEDHGDEFDLKKVSEIDVKTLRKLYDYYAVNKTDSDIPFHELLQGCEIVLPEPKFAERNPELEARIQKLKVEQENKEYRQMTSSLTAFGFPKQTSDVSIAKQMKELNNYLLLVFQFVVSVVTAFAAGFLAPYYFYGMLDMGSRLICGVIFAFVVAVADLYFIIRYFLQSEGVINLEQMEKKYN